MPRLTVEFLLETLSGTAFEGSHFIAEPVIDSRKAVPGSLFIAMAGESADGHDYVGDAIQRGAVAALVEREIELPTAHQVIDLRGGAAPPDSPTPPVLLLVDDTLTALQTIARRWVRQFSARIVGVTGSVGKTTTKEVIADVLGQRFNTLRSEASYNNEIGLPLTVLQLNDQHERAVLEMSMYVPGEIALLCDIAPPQVGVVTLIAPVHLERAKTLQNIINAKTELVRALPPAPEGIAVLNFEDKNVMSMAAHTQARVFTYGLQPAADIWADQIEGLGLDGVRFWLHHADERRQIKLPMLGQHSVHTALRAAAVGLVEGLSWEEIIAGLQQGRNQLRLLTVEGPHGSIILDDTYNASPTSTIAALNLLNDLMEGRRIAVLGDMLELGSYEATGHRRVGVRAAAVADLLVTVGERGRIIAQEAIRSGMPAGAVEPCESAEEALAYLLAQVRSGDAVLVKGSRAVGMERIVHALASEAG
jgi:UDP-N-acetylmuramoyl-tripeptide--D-alanyl-D-alanine ligase